MWVLFNRISAMFRCYAPGLGCVLPFDLPGFPFRQSLKAREQLVEGFKEVIQQKRQKLKLGAPWDALRNVRSCENCQRLGDAFDESQLVFDFRKKNTGEAVFKGTDFNCSSPFYGHKDMFAPTQSAVEGQRIETGPHQRCDQKSTKIGSPHCEGNFQSPATRKDPVRMFRISTMLDTMLHLWLRTGDFDSEEKCCTVSTFSELLLFLVI